MTHYICTGGCHGVSEVPGVCQAENCSKHTQPLVACECTDGKHTVLLGADHESEGTHFEDEKEDQKGSENS